MEELEIQGKKYISSKRASEITGYAKDYVGQLVRAGKVSAQRVGRSWYVDEEEIRRHAGVAASVDVRGTESSMIQAETDAIVSSSIPTTARLIALNTLQTRQSEKNALLKTWGVIHYLSDNARLFPRIATGENKDPQDKPVVIKKKMNTKRLTPYHTPPIPAALSIDGIAAPTLAKPSASTTTSTTSLVVSSVNLTPHRTLERFFNKSFGMRTGATFVAILLFFVVTFGIFGGTALSSEWHFTDQGVFTGNTAELSPAFDALNVLFRGIFDEGIGLIVDFLTFIFQSPRELFDSGLEFIIHILNLG